MIRTIRAGAISAFKRLPILRRVVHAAWEPVLHVALLPFRLPRGRGSAGEQQDLLRRTEEYNLAAERYFAEYPDRQFLLDKPFIAPDFAAYLIAVGVLVAGARLRPGDVVVEFGAGSCWLSHFLNRFGCRTIAVDVSATALDIGRRLFEDDPPRTGRSTRGFCPTMDTRCRWRTAPATASWCTTPFTTSRTSGKFSPRCTGC